MPETEKDKLKFHPAGEKSPPGFYTDEAMTPYKDVTHYNNFYEFGTDKSDPASYAHTLTTEPWRVAIEGEVEKPGR